MSDMFYWILSMSITSSVCIAAVFLFRLLKKIPRHIGIFIWAVPFIRMVLPFGVRSEYSLMNILKETVLRTKTVIIFDRPVDVSLMNIVGLAESYNPIVYKTVMYEKVMKTAFFIWFAVFAAIVISLLIVYFSTMRELRDAKLLRENIYISEKVSSPAVYGIIKPRIILPLSYDEKSLDYVLMHERQHIKRGDNLWRMIAHIVCALHWFNPFVWIALRFFLSDIELACDETVISKLEPAGAKEYALSLLESGKSANVFASAFGGAKIKTRIENILSYKKMTWISAASLAALICALAFVLLTNA